MDKKWEIREKGRDKDAEKRWERKKWIKDGKYEKKGKIKMLRNGGRERTG